MTSAASQSLPNFSESRLATNVVHFILSKHAMLTTASRPDTGTMPSSQPSAATSSSETPSTMMTFMLLRMQCDRA